MLARIEFSLVSLALLLVSVGPSECGIALKGSSFSISSTIIRRTGPEPASRFFVEESYSNEQRRARLDYRIKLTDDESAGEETTRLPRGAATRFRGSFVYDAGRDLAILTENHECTSSSVAEIESTLGLYMPKEADLADDHIVGPARLLFFVDKHRNKMALKSLKGTLGVRNIQCLIYTYAYRDERGKDIQFTVYYSELARAYDGDSSLPIQIEIDFDKTHLLVDFWQPELLAPHSPKMLAREQSGFSSDFSVDMFAFKLLAGCPEALEDKLDSIFGRRLEPSKTMAAGAGLMRQFSFQAKLNSYRVVDLRDTNQELFVAYDKALNSIRVDSLSANSMSVANLAFNRAYYIKDYHHRHHHNRGTDEQQQQQLAVDDDDDDAISSSNSECIVSQVFRGQFRHQEDKFTLEKLLLGSEKFLYMGRGQVQGVNAIVYEARNAMLPFWVDRDFPYRRGNDICMRDALRGILKLLDATGGGERRTLDLVAFFGEEDDEHRLLMLEIQEIDAARTKMFGKMTIFVEDFVWRLDNRAPAGGFDLKASELFSLADRCSAGAGQNRYAQVSMLLESSSQQQQQTIGGSWPTDSLLDIVSVRDTALLASFQDQFTMPASMIYDFESRLKRAPAAASGNPAGGSTGSGSSSSSQIQLSFRVAKHTEQLIDIEFKGLTSRKHLNIPKQLQVASFQDCFMVAASDRELTHFGYQNWNRICVLDSGALDSLLESASGVSPPKEGGQAGQWKDSVDTLELYKLIRRRSWEATNIYNENLVPIKELKTVGLYGVDMAQERISFVVKALRVDSSERRPLSIGSGASSSSSSSGGSEVEQQIVRLGLINGVGILRDPTSRRVIVDSDDSSPTSAMNEERCHAACLASTECRAFSTCVANLEVSCVLTGLQFDRGSSSNNSRLFDALVGLLGEKELAASKFVAKLTLPLPDHGDKQQLELTKHPNCRIRLKNYLDLFAKSGNKLQIIDSKRVYAVTDIGECAQRALMRNIQVLQSGDLSDESHLTAATAASDVDEPREAHRRAIRSLALGFFYIDKQVYEASMQSVKDFISRQMRDLDGLTSVDSISGFCLMNSGLPTELEQVELKSLQPQNGAGAGEKSPPPLNVYISHEYYKFKFELFYERHHGVRLGADSLSAAEQKAFAKLARRAAAAAAGNSNEISDADDIGESELRLVRSFLQAGKNQQIVRSVDAQSCAEFCFGQQRGPWPACKSFDVVQSSFESGTGVQTSCIMNSITLKEAYENERYELINDDQQQAGGRHQIAVHYEPRPGFVSSSEWQLADTRAELEFMANLLQSSRSIRLHALGITFIVLISLIMGLTVGLVGGTRLFHRLAARRQQQQSNESNPVMANESKVIEFSNQVNSEGSIKVH